MSMREKLLGALGSTCDLRRVLIDAGAEAGIGYYSGLEADIDSELEEILDAILTTLADPDFDMLRAAASVDDEEHEYVAIWRAMLATLANIPEQLTKAIPAKAR